MKRLYDNLIEKKPLPSWAINTNISNWFFYTGKSMNPAFIEGDIIYTKPGTMILPGDIIVFRDTNAQQITVHRVIYVTKEGFITRGDNNSFFDCNPVVPGQLLGIVKFVENEGQIRAVPDGERELMKIMKLWRVRGWLRILKAPFRLFYRTIKKSGIVRLLLGKWFHKKVTKIYLENRAGSLMKIVYKGKTIAVKWSVGTFNCKKPFDLLIVETKNGFS
jgi:signal peptidase I